MTLNYYTDPGNSPSRVSGGCSHINPELWGAETSKKAAFDQFISDNSIIANALGVVGKEAMFVRIVSLFFFLSLSILTQRNVGTWICPEYKSWYCRNL